MRRWPVILVAIAGASGQTFDVASVKIYRDDGGPRNSRSYSPHGVTFGGCSLGFIIGEAYNFPVGQLQGPNSLRQGYDVVGRADNPVSKDQVRLMLQSLLAERFGLTLHRDTRSERVYMLVVAKDGPKLEESQKTAESFGFSGGPTEYVFRNAEMMRLSGFLSGQVDRIVVDHTGLAGIYNFVLKKPDTLPQDSPAKSEGRSPDSFTAGNFATALKQLGLQLTPGTAPVDYLVVDRVERPSDN